jgi:hypothetical protein
MHACCISSEYHSFISISSTIRCLGSSTFDHGYDPLHACALTVKITRSRISTIPLLHILAAWAIFSYACFLLFAGCSAIDLRRPGKHYREIER